MEVYFKRHRAFMRLVPSERGVIITVRWDTADTPRFARLPFDFPSELVVDADKSEVGGKTYDELKAETTARRNDLLGRIIITDIEEKKRIMISALTPPKSTK